jgi:transcriptional regulator with XRE-family HTH domain
MRLGKQFRALRAIDGFSNRLRALRLQHGQTQKDVAEAVQCTITAVSQWELGRCEPSLESLVLLAVHFDTTLDWLIRGKR